jgi:hypothetical protein
MEEIWKNIEGYEGQYQISNLGRVKSLERLRKTKCGGQCIVKERIMSPADNGDGYLQIQLCKDSKPKHLLVHRLVAVAFIDNSNNLSQINHKDEDKHNNCADNLEWCDSTYNNNYGAHIQKISKPVICIETGERFNSISDVYRTKGYNVGYICLCCKGIRNKAYGYHWKYVEKEIA